MSFSSSSPYVVFGVTGRTGAAAAEALLRAGQPVRVVVRDIAKGRAWADRGAEVVAADLTDLVSMSSALANARGAYVVSPQDYQRGDLFDRAALIAETTARAVAAAGVPRVVALSSVGADRETHTGWIGMNRMLEQQLGAAGVSAVFLRAAYFMENWAPMVQAAVRSGTLATFLAPANRPLPMVATEDVGTAAAGLLQEQGSASRVVTLSGPRSYSPADVAEAVSVAIGKRVEVAVLPQAQWPEALAGAGFSAPALAGFTEMTCSLNTGHIDMGSDAKAIARAGGTELEQVIANLLRAQAA